MDGVQLMVNSFRACEIMLPKNCDFTKWAVIACDQHTSEPEYWENVRTYVGNAPSTIKMFFPEADLNKVSDELFEQLSANMESLAEQNFYNSYPSSYIYVERTLMNGSIRQGVIGVVDLEYYDYDPKSTTRIFATEATVLQRVPPRIALRKLSSMEFSHTVMFCDDKTNSLVEPIGKVKNQLEKLYDFNLMTNGGRITGYLLNGTEAKNFEQRVSEYERDHAYLVGDGNHSLVTAKLIYEAMKESNQDIDWLNHPARYAMVELENINSDAMVFEPIYRIAVCDESNEMLDAFLALDDANGVPFTWFYGSQKGIVRISVNHELPIEALQRFLDDWFATHNGSVDYIHGSETVRKLAQNTNTIGFLQPDFNKSVLFPYILSGKVMPKKTFSIGHAEEKRYYLEGRMIK